MGRKLGSYSITSRRMSEVVKLLRCGFVKHAEAYNEKNEPCHFADEQAVRWDIAGAMAKVMGLEAGWSLAAHVYAIVANSSVVPSTQFGFAKLVDWWDSATDVMYESAIRRLTEFVNDRVSGK